MPSDSSAKLGIIRTIATGSIIVFFQHDLQVGDLPMDFVIFSMGAGVLQHAGG